MKSYKGKNIRVSDDHHETLKSHLSQRPGIRVPIIGWVEEAIDEKIARETKKPKRFKVNYETK